MKKSLQVTIVLLMSGILVFFYLFQTDDNQTGGRKRGEHAVPVEATEIKQGPIELRRTFTGTLEASAQLIVAPKVDGRVERLLVDLSDAVVQGQQVAELDDAEYVQSVNQAEAELAVTKAQLREAESLLSISQRELERLEELLKRKVSSESQYNLALTDYVSKKAHLDVARAQLQRAESQLQTARIRLGYTRISANWQTDQNKRVVAERYIDEGDTVSANTPLLRIVSLNPITAVFYVTERDYAYLKPGQTARLYTDVYPNRDFVGEISRVAPVFREDTRQARVELKVSNPELFLKPGMFVRSEVVLRRINQTTLIPEQAITSRDGQSGIFLINSQQGTASWQPVTIGIQQGKLVQIENENLSGQVITLGQQLLKDGAAIVLASPGRVSQ